MEKLCEASVVPIMSQFGLIQPPNQSMPMTMSI